MVKNDWVAWVAILALVLAVVALVVVLKGSVTGNAILKQSESTIALNKMKNSVIITKAPGYPGKYTCNGLCGTKICVDAYSGRMDNSNPDPVWETSPIECNKWIDVFENVNENSLIQCRCA